MSNNVILESHLDALASTLANILNAILTKLDTIERKIDSTSGGSSSSKATPTLSLSSWTCIGTTYTATISYNGDGSLSTSLGTISGSTLTVYDQDGIFNGTIYASEGNSFAPASLDFSYTYTNPTTPVAPVTNQMIVVDAESGDEITEDTTIDAGNFIFQVTEPTEGVSVSAVNSSEEDLIELEVVTWDSNEQTLTCETVEDVITITFSADDYHSVTITVNPS